jgi:endonuclease-8
MEGPSLAILKEELQVFLGQRVLQVQGNTKQPKESLKHRKLERIETWGKNLFLTFESTRRSVPAIVTKTHFLMFGSYRVNAPRPDRIPRLELKFKNGVLYFYSCSIRFDAADHLKSLDRRVDLMSSRWDKNHVVALMNEKRDALLCDLFLDQNVFAGSGNIVKNEVLFNIRRHPLTKLSGISKKDWPKLAEAVHSYCWNFYEWKKKFELRKHWQVYAKAVCPLCQQKLKRESLGKFKRRTFYCPQHQALRSRVSGVSVHDVLPLKGPAEREARLDH